MIDIYKYFRITDLLAGFSWLVILIIITYYVSTTLKTEELARLYRRNFYFKVLFAFVFVIYYILIVGGGDTLAYWHNGECIQNLLLSDPTKGAEVFYIKPTPSNYTYYFNDETGWPVRSVYLEESSHFVSKMVAVIGALSLKSFFATTFIFAFLFAHANWKIYELFLKTKLFKSQYLHFAILFIPSVSFWCSGVTKDTIMIISFFYIFYHLYSIMFEKKYNSIRSWAILLVYFYFVYNIRGFMMVAILVPIFVMIIKRTASRMQLAPVLKVPFNVLMLLITIGIAVAFMSSNQGSEIIMKNESMQEALLVQNDFESNTTYGSNKYSLGQIDYSPFGIVKAMPISIITGIYQPFPWNGLSLSLIFNALESLVLLILSFQIILSGKAIKWAQKINENPWLIFCLTFVIMMAFISGFTAIIYGVLVRIRAPLLPFWFALLIVDLNSQIKTKSSDNIIN